MAGMKVEVVEELLGKAITLKDWIACQGGAIVSKTLLTKPNGTVTLFGFGAGQGLSEHTAPFDAMVYIVEGTMEITIAGQPHTVGQGQLFIMPANRPHALHASADAKMLLIMIRS